MASHGMMVVASGNVWKVHEAKAPRFIVLV